MVRASEGRDQRQFCASFRSCEAVVTLAVAVDLAGMFSWRVACVSSGP